MSEVNKGLTIGNPNDVARIAGRLARLKQSVERADGDRKAALEAEIDGIKGKLADIRAALEAAGV